MAYLQLAERNNSEQAFYNSLAENPKQFYVFVPNEQAANGGVWVREDYFDNLPADEWSKTMAALAPYQPQQMSGIISNIRENIQERRERRDIRRDARTEAVQQGGTFGQRILNTVGSLFGKGDQAAQTKEMQLPEYQVQIGNEPKQWYQNPVVIVGGLAAIGGIIYLATRKK